MDIRQKVRELLSELPPGVRVVAAAKTRQPEEILEAVAAGITIVGENYVQEAARARELIGEGVEWHFIGHLQKNKVKKAIELFDMIETVDSAEMTREIDRRCAEAGRVLPVLIEVNSGREEQKAGVLPELVEQLVREVAALPNIRVMGLMTMGPAYADAGAIRTCFVTTKELFDSIRRLALPGVEMKYLSMGMTDSYRVAVAEGANMVRIGSGIFGARDYG